MVQELEDRLAVPARMAKLDHIVHLSRRRASRYAQPVVVAFQVRRQLEHYGSTSIR